MKMPIAPQTAEGGFLPARGVWERYKVSRMTIDRWVADENLGFPAPTYIGKRRYWPLADLEAWERQQAVRRIAAVLMASRQRKKSAEQIFQLGAGCEGSAPSGEDGLMQLGAGFKATPRTSGEDA